MPTNNQRTAPTQSSSAKARTTSGSRLEQHLCIRTVMAITWYCRRCRSTERSSFVFRKILNPISQRRSALTTTNPALDAGSRLYSQGKLMSRRQFRRLFYWCRPRRGWLFAPEGRHS